MKNNWSHSYCKGSENQAASLFQTIRSKEIREKSNRMSQVCYQRENKQCLTEGSCPHSECCGCLGSSCLHPKICDQFDVSSCMKY